MDQPLLTGFSCDSTCSVAVAADLGLPCDHFCDPTQPTCCNPNRNPDIQKVLVAVNGLHFDDLPNNVPIPPLPRAISTIPGDDGGLPFGTRHFGLAVATRYTQVRGLRSGQPDLSAKWRQMRNVPPHRLVLLHQESGDDPLETLFAATLRPTFFQSVSLIGNVVLVSPGYSVYDDGSMCGYLQDVNIKRSLHFAVEANRAGLPCIPSIAWDRNRPRHLERISDWLVRQGEKITHLAVNAQTGSSTLWTELVTGMMRIEQLAGCRYTWLVFGGVNALSVAYRHIDSERVVHISASAPTHTLNHRLIGERTTNDLPSEELLRQNLAREAAQRQIAAMNAGHALRSSP